MTWILIAHVWKKLSSGLPEFDNNPKNVHVTTEVSCS